MSFLINPFAFAVAGGDFESIATVTVGSGGASSIEFTSIPGGTYQHLQIRGVCKDARSSTNAPFSIRLNSDSGSNYTQHELQGSGASANAYSATSVTSMRYIGYTAADQANIFGGAIVDILDYANTSKNTVARAFSGVDNNGSGVVAISSGLWLNTAAVTTVTLLPFTSPFGQHSTFALFGVKAP